MAKRFKLSRSKSRKSFTKYSGTKRANVRPPVMRGGTRF